MKFRVPSAQKVYRTLMGILAAVLLLLFLACTIQGVLTLCLYEDLTGVGLMVVGVVLYFSGKLALAEREASR